MILNVSGRTDIVAFYSKWLLNRLKKGYVDVRNPFNKDLVSRIYFEDVDLIFFCTKNPTPILDKIKEINKKMYFHITLTPYKKDIEPLVPNKMEVISSIKKLSKLIGKDNIVIRYDPVFISEKYNLEYHKKAFAKVCALLEGYVSSILISFIDDYKNVRNHYSSLKYKKLTKEDYKEIGTSFSRSAHSHNLSVFTCFETEDLVEYGFAKRKCMSKELAYALTGKVYNEEWKARNCHCISMVDIGQYNTCSHYCSYCYANYDEKKVRENSLQHDQNSSLLIGHLKATDKIIRRKDKKVSSTNQLSLFE